MAEEMNSGKRSLLIVLVATVLVVAAIAVYVYIGEKPPVAAGKILKLDVVPIHSQMRVGEGAEGVQGGMETYDQLIVLADVEIRNQTDIPLFLHDMWGNLTSADGEEQRSLGANKTDFQNAFLAYPQLAALKQEPLMRDITLNPGQTVQGLIIVHYPITKDQWDARHGFEADISFMHQKNLVLPWPAPAK
ncbi:hypothetical protein [Acidobacterium sp. S8]|uniref:hypothetical protein n=1 Tax=Acidobacterium sp. S8 TaxID=1641854 RepID=UPI00131D6571|nr:hypothetical protein [Acidobacterium sp. S8]